MVGLTNISKSYSIGNPPAKGMREVGARVMILIMLVVPRIPRTSHRRLGISNAAARPRRSSSYHKSTWTAWTDGRYIAGIISATARTSHQTTCCSMRPQNNLLPATLQRKRQLVDRWVLPKIVLWTEAILMTKMKIQRIRERIKKNWAVLTRASQPNLTILITKMTDKGAKWMILA